MFQGESRECGWEIVTGTKGSGSRGPRAARELGAFIREALKRSLLANQKALADAAKQSDSVVSDLVTASRPVPKPTVLAIAKAISADEAWLEDVESRWLAAKAGDIPRDRHLGHARAVR